MILFPHTRDMLVKLLRKGGVGCEIGVAEGKFSRTLVAETKPKEIHLIDPWTYQDDDAYISDPNNVSKVEGDRRFRMVSDSFSEESASGQLFIHRAFSTDVVSHFPDRHFDWIYVDARHDYDSVLQDLTAYLPKLKPDGLLLGHDYANHDFARRSGFGVVDAVDEFCMDNDLKFVTLTCETLPTYVLSRTSESPEVRNILNNIHFHFEHAIELPNYPRHHRLDLGIAEVKDAYRPVLRFKPRLN